MSRKIDIIDLPNGEREVVRGCYKLGSISSLHVLKRDLAKINQLIRSGPPSNSFPLVDYCLNFSLQDMYGNPCFRREELLEAGFTEDLCDLLEIFHANDYDSLRINPKVHVMESFRIRRYK